MRYDIIWASISFWNSPGETEWVYQLVWFKIKDLLDMGWVTLEWMSNKEGGGEKETTQWNDLQQQECQ